MKIFKLSMILFCFISLSFTVNAQTKKDKKVMDAADKAVKTLLDVQPGIRKFFDNNAGCVIFPNVGKGGFIVGGASGRGVLYSYGHQVGMATVKELNVGLTAGGQALIEIIFFETKEEVEKFKEGHFQFDAGVSAVAIKSGESFDAKYKNGVAVFTHTKGGLMAEASVGGQKFNYHPFNEK